MPEGVRGDVGQRLFVLLVVLLHKAPDHVVVVHPDFRQTVLVEKQKVRVAVHHDSGFLPPVLHYPLQRPIDQLTYGDFPVAVLGLGRFDIVAVPTVPQKLVVYPNRFWEACSSAPATPSATDTPRKNPAEKSPELLFQVPIFAGKRRE